MRRVGLIITLLVAVVYIYGQNYSTGSKKAIRLFEEAVVLFQGNDPLGAEELLLKAIRSDTRFIEAYHLLSQICYNTRRLEKAIAYYSRTLEIDPDGNPDGYRLLAGLVLKTGDYNRTMELLERFLSFPPESVKGRE